MAQQRFLELLFANGRKAQKSFIGRFVFLDLKLDFGLTNKTRNPCLATIQNTRRNGNPKFALAYSHGQKIAANPNDGFQTRLDKDLLEQL